MSEVVRINTRISKKLNAWLDKKSLETGVSKSGLVAMAVENYMKEMEVVDNLPVLIRKLEEMGITVDELRQ